MDMKGVGPLSVAGVVVTGMDVMGVKGVSVKVGWGEGVKVKVALGCGGVSGVDEKMAVIGAARITGVGE